MNAENSQIVKAYEELGLSVDEIAQQMDSHESVIKSILMQCSSAYRKDSKKNPALEFEEDVQEEAKNILVGIMRYECEGNPELKFKVAKFIREDGNGRLDAGRALANMPGNVAINFNLQYAKAIAAKERTLAKAKVVTDGEARELEVVK